MTYIYASRPKDAASTAVVACRQVFDLTPIHFQMGVVELDELTRSADPPGKVLLQMYDGCMIIVDPDFLGCALIAVNPLTDEVVPLTVVWEEDEDDWDDDELD